MSLSEENAHKFAAYTLLCHCLVMRLRRLYAAIRADKRLEFEDCVKAINNALQMLFKAKVTSQRDAVFLVSINLSAYASSIKLMSPKVAEVLERAVADVARLGNLWSYERGIERCHRQGRKLAQIFFANSPWAETQRRLSKRASLHYEHGDPNIRELARALANRSLHSDLREQIETLIVKYEARLKDSYDTRTASLYTFEHETDGTYTIYVPFDDQHDFMLYLSYPYLFMHEYTAHIFSTDYDNDRFNDGWMLYAASFFLLRNWNRDERLSFLKKQQANAFREYLFGRLKGVPREECTFAEDFNLFLSSWAPQKFDEITFELAAYVHSPSQTQTWPTKLLRRLSDEYFANPNALERRMRMAANMDLLYPGLKNETDIWS